MPFRPWPHGIEREQTASIASHGGVGRQAGDSGTRATPWFATSWMYIHMCVFAWCIVCASNHGHRPT